MYARFDLRLDTALVLLALAACATPGTDPAPPKPLDLRFYLAAESEEPEHRATKDEAGRPLYVAPQPFVTAADVKLASVTYGERRAMVLVELTPMAEAVLADVTAAHLGHRLAICVGDDVILSPVIRGPLRHGKVFIDGDFTRAQAEEWVRRLNAHRAGAAPPSEHRQP